MTSASRPPTARARRRTASGATTTRRWEPGLGGSTESDGVFTLTGSGDIGEVTRPFGDDLVELSLAGAMVGVRPPRHSGRCS